MLQKINETSKTYAQAWFWRKSDFDEERYFSGNISYVSVHGRVRMPGPPAVHGLRTKSTRPTYREAYPGM